MAQSSKNLVSLTAAEHIGPDETGDNIEAKKVAVYRWNPTAGVSGEWERDTDYRFAGGKQAAVATLTTSGDTTIVTPASGDAVRLYWFSAITDPDDTATTLIKVLIGSTELYRFFGNMAHWEVFEGAADEVLKVNLTANGNVAFTAHYTTFTP